MNQVTKQEIYLPNRLTRLEINELMSKVINRDKEPISEEIVFNFTNLSFIEPAGVTSLGNLFEWLRKKNVKTTIIWPKEIGKTKWCPIKYLDDSKFFLKYLGRKLNDESSVRETTIPLQNVTYSRSYQWLEATFITWLAGQLGVKIATLGNIKTCLGEVFNNIRDHSSENIGLIYAQHFPARNKIVISIADFGVGIPTNIRKKSPALQDAEALVLAIEDGYSTYTSPRNLGAGLHTLIKNVVEDSNGTVHIHSGYGILNTEFVHNDIQVSSSTSNGFYPGTFLEICIDTSKIMEEDKYEIEEEFEW
ncbi:ATP-binding protein [Peribacillus simplex]|uniref:ATP-binding protein n=1 Tax=Peribacillus simplex TaxID=1478 RepID=UPI002E21C565|nr:ATP-binding protein [Peribacillus simplex]MED4096834.1 ATP-binding protein [Peribacillus simplex]